MSKKKLENAIVIVPEQALTPEITALPEALVIQSELLVELEKITTVSSPEEQQIAVKAVAEAKGFAREIAKLGLDARRPHDAIKSKILEIERTITDPIEVGVERVEGFLTTYTIKLRREAEIARAEEERKRQQALKEEQEKREELARLERERLAAVAKAAREAEEAAAAARKREEERVAAEKAAKEREEAEKKRIEELEAARKQAEINAQNAKDQAAKDEALANQARIEREAAEAKAAAETAKHNEEMARQKREQDEANAATERSKAEAKATQEETERLKAELAAEFNLDAASEAVTEICSATPTKVATGVTGAAVYDGKNDVKVTDVHALYAAHRQCVDLKPRLSAIDDLIRAGITEIPGVSIIQRTKVNVRGTRTPRLS